MPVAAAATSGGVASPNPRIASINHLKLLVSVAAAEATAEARASTEEMGEDQTDVCMVL